MVLFITGHYGNYHYDNWRLAAAAGDDDVHGDDGVVLAGYTTLFRQTLFQRSYSEATLLTLPLPLTLSLTMSISLSTVGIVSTSRLGLWVRTEQKRFGRKTDRITELHLAFWTENGIHIFGRTLDGKRENGQKIAEKNRQILSHSLALTECFYSSFEKTYAYNYCDENGTPVFHKTSECIKQL